LRQLFTRPTVRIDPYSTPVSGLYICSSSTPPGGGVHGLCGYFAAQSALGLLGAGNGSLSLAMPNANAGADVSDITDVTPAGRAPTAAGEL
ncbi:MAG TPA: hypothetical protein VFS83_19985, partial [Ktedonobacterales bacterium]|nr:hypothetical protein [Ktedonobacterales bacterium]